MLINYNINGTDKSIEVNLPIKLYTRLDPVSKNILYIVDDNTVFKQDPKDMYEYGVINTTDNPLFSFIAYSQFSDIELSSKAVSDAYDEIISHYTIESSLGADNTISGKVNEIKEVVNNMLTRLEFMNLFTDSELAAIYTSAKNNVSMEIFLDKLKLAENVDLDNPSVLATLDALETSGVLTTARKEAILAKKAP